MIWAILAPFRKALAWAGAAFVIIGGAWLAGRRDAKQAAKSQSLKDYQATRKEMDDAEADLGSDPGVIRDWLRERGKQ